MKLSACQQLFHLRLSPQTRWIYACDKQIMNRSNVDYKLWTDLR